MSPRIHSIARVAITLLIAGATTSRGGPSEIAITGPTVPSFWNQPVAFTVEARAVEQTAAFGLHVVRPIFHRPSSTVLVEAYGYEGESKLGLVGGGAIYRREIGTQSSFEANAFFEGLRSEDGFSYPQFGAGMAFRPNAWLALLANGYLPLRGKDSRPHGRYGWSEESGSGSDWRETNYWRELRAERAPMRGFDVEMQLRLPKPPSWIDPRVAIGYAYREAEDRPEVYAGMTVRGELHFAKHWVAEAEWRQDAHGIRQEWRVGLRFEMLLGAESGREVSRANERYLPAQRFPWPTVARGLAEGKGGRGETRSLAPVVAPKPAQPDPEDCCPSGNGALIFD